MAILKLAYLNMLGYDMSWATFGIVEVSDALDTAHSGSEAVCLQVFPRHGHRPP